MVNYGNGSEVFEFVRPFLAAAKSGQIVSKQEMYRGIFECSGHGVDHPALSIVGPTADGRRHWSGSHDFVTGYNSTYQLKVEFDPSEVICDHFKDTPPWLFKFVGDGFLPHWGGAMIMVFEQAGIVLSANEVIDLSEEGWFLPLARPVPMYARSERHPLKPMVNDLFVGHNKGGELVWFVLKGGWHYIEVAPFGADFDAVELSRSAAAAIAAAEADRLRREQERARAQRMRHAEVLADRERAWHTANAVVFGPNYKGRAYRG